MAGPRILIIGAGFSGLGMAVALKRAGHTAFTVLERGATVGGTWRDNTYPGCACDVPSHLYSFSFDPHFDWARPYATQAQILAYLQQISTRHGIDPHLRLSTAVAAARWSERGQHWQVELANGEQLHAEVLINASGGLVEPAWPDIPGLADFRGPVLHSARWPAGTALRDLRGRRVGLVGTGASAIQIGPALANDVAQLHIFQRSAPWVMPRGDRPYGLLRRWLYRHVPGLLRLNRWRVYIAGEILTLAFLDHPWAQHLLRRLGERHLRDAIADPALRALATPRYAPGCKRVLLSDDWYPLLQRPEVRLITQGIDRITPEGVVCAEGQLHTLDALVLATGFNVTQARPAWPIIGRDARPLAAHWAQGAATHLGISTHGFPNYFALMGPGTGLGSNSIVFMIEAQARHIAQAVGHIARHGVVLELRPEVQAASDDRLQSRLQRTVWAQGGCASWYRSATGRIDTLWPGLSLGYWWRTRRFDARSYHATPRTPQPLPSAHLPSSPSSSA